MQKHKIPLSFALANKKGLHLSSEEFQSDLQMDSPNQYKLDAHKFNNEILSSFKYTVNAAH